MIKIKNEQIERVSQILSGIPNGAEKALFSAIRRGNSTVKTQVIQETTSVYAISKQNLRADTTIRSRVKKDSEGIVGEITFSGYKIPLYRFNVFPTHPTQGASVSAAVLRDSSRTPFVHAFIAKMESGHTGIFERRGTARFPIKERMGLSTAQMAANRVVLEKVEEKAQEVVDRRIEHEITRILNGYGG